MIHLALAVACSLSIGMIFKHTGRTSVHRLELLTVNYLAAVALSVLFLSIDGRSVALDLTPGLVTLGVATGALFICGFFLLSLATEVAGMGLAVGVMRVSVVVPFLASWWIWNEVPTAAQGAGLVVAMIAFFLIAGGRSRANLSPVDTGGRSPLVVSAILVLVFVAGGLVDTLLKTFEELYSATTGNAIFLSILFAVAFLIGLIIRLPAYLRRGELFDRRAIGWGILLGAVNYGSVEFLLGAIARLSGTFVFPANNIAIVIGAALLGVAFWGERLSRPNVLGLVLATVALLLLNF
jgi:drug/metabolite transporter (DMT)-like permease